MKHLNSPHNMLTFTLLAAALLYVSIVRLGIYQNSVQHDIRLSYSAKGLVEWSQPERSDTQRSITNKLWDIDIAKIEQLLWRSQIDDSTGKLAINEHTLTLLEQTHSLLTDSASASDLNRVQYLIHKGFPSSKLESDSHGQQLADLVDRYYRYRKEADVAKTTIHQVSDEHKRRILVNSMRDTTARQVKFFGAVLATKLFARKNNHRNYIYQRSLVTSNTKLSDRQKLARLASLQYEYQDSLLAVTPLTEQ